MTKKIQTLVAAVAACAALMALPSQAQVVNSGLYLGGSAGQTKYKGDNVGGFSTDRSDKGGKIYGGYEFTPNIALELGYADLGTFSSAVGSVSGEGPYLDVVGKMPFTPKLSGLARVGVFNGKADFTSPLISDTERNAKPKVGLGLQYDFTPNIAVRGEWERYHFEAFGNKANTDMASVGVNFRF